MRLSTPFKRCLSVVLASSQILWSNALLGAMLPGDSRNIAVISNVNGEAFVRPAEDPGRARAASFKGPVVYGDRITTSKDSTLGLLLEQRDLLTVLENSNVEIKEPKPGFKVIDMSSGKVCLATSRLMSKEEHPTAMWTPSMFATAQPGTLFQLEVNANPMATRNSLREKPALSEGRGYRTSLFAETNGAAAVTTETLAVIEGSVDIVSQVTASAPVRVTSGRAVKVVNGSIGEPYAAPSVTCRLQDAQVTPVHTTIPPGARDIIATREIEQAERLVAYVHKPPTPPAPQDLQHSVPGGLVLPTTRLYAFGGGAAPPPPVFPGTGQPVLVFQDSHIQLGMPLVEITDPANTKTGPTTLFQLNGFAGNNANVPLAFVGPNIVNLNEYRNPDDPTILQASMQVRTTSGVSVILDHGVSLTNSTIAPAPGYTGPVVQIEDSRVTAFTPTVPGILVRLTNSQLTSNDFLLHQNSSPLNQTTLNGTLLQAEQGSQVTVNGTFANVDPSTIIVNGSLLTLTGGSTLSTTGPLIDLSGSTLTGNLAPLVNVNGGTLNLGTAGNPAGLARLTNSTLIANAGLLSILNGSVNNTGTFITMAGASAVNGTGNLIAVGNGGTLNLASGGLFGGTGTVTVTGGDVLNISGTGTLTNTSAAAPVFTIGTGPSVTTDGALLNVSGNGKVALEGPLLRLIGGTIGAGTAPLIQVTGGSLSASSVGSALLSIDGPTSLNRTALAVSGGTAFGGMGIGAALTTSPGAPLFRIYGGSLTAFGALASVNNSSLILGDSLLSQTGGTVFLGPFGLNSIGQTTMNGTRPIFDISGGSLTVTSNLVNARVGSLNTGGPLLSLTAGEVTAGLSVLALTSGSSVTAAGNLVNLTGGTLAAEALLLQTGGDVTAGGGLTISGGTLASGTSPLFGISGGTLTTINGGHLVQMSGGTVNLGGPLLHMSAPVQTTTIAGDLLVMTGGSVTGPPSGSLIIVSAGTLNVGGSLVSVGPDATLNLRQASLGSTNGTAIIAVTGNLLNVSGTVLNSGATGPVFSIGPGSNITTGDALVKTTGTGRLTLVGPVLQLTGGMVSAVGGLTVAAPLTTAAGAPLFTVTGGTLATPGSSLVTLGANLTLGDSILVQNAGAVGFGIHGLSATTQVLTSTAPSLFNQGGGNFDVGKNLVDVAGGVISTGPLLSLTGGTAVIGISFGSLLNLTSGATASITGNMVNVSGSGFLGVGTGGLLTATGGSAVTISGGLLSTPSGALNGAGTLINLSDSKLTITAPVPAVSVATDLHVTTGILFATGSAVTLGSTNAALASVGGGTTVPSALVSVQDGKIMDAGLVRAGGGRLITLSGSTLVLPNSSPLFSVQGAGSQLFIVGDGDLLILRNGSTLVNLTPTQEIISVSKGGNALIFNNLLTLDNNALPARSAPLLTVNAETDTNLGLSVSQVAFLTNSSALTINNASFVSILNTDTIGQTFSLGTFATSFNGSVLNVQSHLADISNSTVTLFSHGVRVIGGTLNVTGPLPANLINLSNNSTLNASQALLLLTNGATATINGMVASVPAGSALNPLTTLIVSIESTLTVNGNSALSVGSTTTAGSNASLAIANGGLLSSSGGALTFASQLASITGGNGSAGATGGAGGNALLATRGGAVALSETMASGTSIFVGAGNGGNATGGSGGAGGTASFSTDNGGVFSMNSGNPIRGGATAPNIIKVVGGAGGAAPGTALGGNGGAAALFGTHTLIGVVSAPLTTTDHAITVSGGDGGSLTGGSVSGGTAGAGGQATVSIAEGGLLAASAGTVTVNNLLAGIVGGNGGNGGLAGPGGAGGNATLTGGGTLIRLDGAVFSSNGITVLGGSGGSGTTPGANGPGNITIQSGSVLTATGGKVESFGKFVAVNGNLTATGVLIDLTNMHGASPVNFHDDVINISDSVLCNTPGQCSRAPGVLQATDVGSAATPIQVGGTVMRLDQALFEATAPLISLVRSHLATSSALAMANNASYLSSNPANAFASLDASTLNANGALVSMSSGTFTHAGNLVSLANASTLIANTLAFISGGSFNVGGALVALSGVGNTLTINANCGGGCTTFGVNVPILFQNGATLGNTTVNIPATYNAFSGATAGNTLPGLTKPLLIVDGPTAKTVKLGP